MTTETTETENINLNVKVPKKRGRKPKALSLDKMEEIHKRMIQHLIQ